MRLFQEWDAAEVLGHVSVSKVVFNAFDSLSHRTLPSGRSSDTLGSIGERILSIMPWRSFWRASIVELYSSE